MLSYRHTYVNVYVSKTNTPNPCFTPVGLRRAALTSLAYFQYLLIFSFSFFFRFNALWLADLYCTNILFLTRISFFYLRPLFQERN